MKPTIYYLCPDIEKPVGGIKIIYAHVDTLNKFGISAFVLHQEEGFRCKWFENNSCIAYKPLTKIKKFDYIVISEVFGPDITYIEIGVNKVIFNQNAHYTFSDYSLDLDDLETPYLHQDIVATIVISEHSYQYLNYVFPQINLHRLYNGFDFSLFHYGYNKRRQIAYMPRKLSEDIAQVICILKFRGALKDFEFVPIDNKKEREVAEILQDSLFFLSFSEIEGCPMPPIEAMACGCVVIGYDGIGGKEYFHSDFSYPIEERNILAFAETIESLITEYEVNPGVILDKGEKASMYVQEMYSSQKAEQSIINFWHKTLNTKKTSV